MDEVGAIIKQCEGQIEQALQSLEMRGEPEAALAAYREAETTLESWEFAPDDPLYAEQQRVLAYCLMRQGNILRQLGRPQEALASSRREIEAARASGDDIALARSLMSNGANRIVAGKTESGLEMIEEARALFERGESYDHRQGLGWHWILQAELVNAGLVSRERSAVLDAAERALEILLPLENWPGVVRAYAARAQAHEALGNDAVAAADREAKKQYEGKIEREEENSIG